MRTLLNVIKFIKLKGYKIRVFEKEAGLSNGTINGCKKRKKDLSAENIKKIVEKYSTELIAAGFLVIDSSVGEGKAIVSKEEKIKNEGDETSFVNDPNVDYDTLIEINTPAGKKLFKAPSNKKEIAIWNAYLAEKDERQKESEQRAEKAEQEKDTLYSVIKQNLSVIQQTLSTLLIVTNRIDEKLGDMKTGSDTQ